MVARLWDILIFVAFAAFVLASLLGGISLILSELGAVRGQLALAGVAEVLVSVTFFIAGAGTLFAAARVMRNREPLLGRLVFAACALVASYCWLTIGVRGSVWPEIIRAAVGLVQ